MVKIIPYAQIRRAKGRPCIKAKPSNPSKDLDMPQKSVPCNASDDDDQTEFTYCAFNIFAM